LISVGFLRLKPNRLGPSQSKPVQIIENFLRPFWF
jgi:hypothetical protein